MINDVVCLTEDEAGGETEDGACPRGRVLGNEISKRPGRRGYTRKVVPGGSSTSLYRKLYTRGCPLVQSEEKKSTKLQRASKKKGYNFTKSFESRRLRCFGG